MALSQDTLPRWDLTCIYPSLESPEFAEGFRQTAQAITALVALYDQEGIGKQPPAPLDQATVERFERVIARTNEVLEATGILDAYIYGHVCTDSRDTQALARWSELQQETMKLALLDTRLTAWLGGLDVEALLVRSPVARDHELVLLKAQIEAQHQMSPEEEALATELNLTGGAAWADLYRNYSSQLVARIELDGQMQELPMSALRNLAQHPDRDVRCRAYETELAAWEQAAVPIAASLNSIKGEVNTLTRRRGWSSPLDAALLDSNIDRQTLDAMLTAARESFPDFRRYLRAKAQAFGVPACAWYDLLAPVSAPDGQGSRVWDWDAATAFVVEQFHGYSDTLGGMAERAFRERWVDAGPRPCKEGGAFCMQLRPGESRVLLNYSPDFGEVSTLAHELGHAYHDLILARRTPLQRETPMTLAETASIFCQRLTQKAALALVGPQEQLAILESSLQDACMIVVDITSRFLFESRLFDQRRARELSVDELKALMLEAQRETYGDGLDPDSLHPYMWAAKPHYYSTETYFYNFPYMFGLLFVLGLYARYEQEPEAFKASYDDLLSATGLEQAAPLAARFGMDIRTPDFWRSSLDVLRGDIDRFETLVQAITQQQDKGEAR